MANCVQEEKYHLLSAYLCQNFSQILPHLISEKEILATWLYYHKLKYKKLGKKSKQVNWTSWIFKIGLEVSIYYFGYCCYWTSHYSNFTPTTRIPPPCLKSPSIYLTTHSPDLHLWWFVVPVLCLFLSHLWKIILYVPFFLAYFTQHASLRSAKVVPNHMVLSFLVATNITLDIYANF